eukprot:1157396-Pelagomonas_calceolata.AAC.8
MHSHVHTHARRKGIWDEAPTVHRAVATYLSKLSRSVQVTPVHSISNWSRVHSSRVSCSASNEATGRKGRRNKIPDASYKERMRSRSPSTSSTQPPFEVQGGYGDNTWATPGLGSSGRMGASQDSSASASEHGSSTMTWPNSTRTSSSSSSSRDRRSQSQGTRTQQQILGSPKPSPPDPVLVRGIKSMKDEQRPVRPNVHFEELNKEVGGAVKGVLG